MPTVKRPAFIAVFIELCGALLLSHGYKNVYFLFAAASLLVAIFALVRIPKNKLNNTTGVRAMCAFTLFCVFSAVYPSLYYTAHNAAAVSFCEKYAGEYEHSGYISESFGTPEDDVLIVKLYDGGKSVGKCALRVPSGTGGLCDNVRFSGKLFPIIPDDRRVDGIFFDKVCSEGCYVACDPQSVTVSKGELSKPKSLRQYIYLRMRLIFSEMLGTYHGVDAAAYARSLVIGDKKAVDRGTRNDFRSVGLMPVLCISGLHFLVTARLLDFLLSLTGLPGRAKALILCLSVFILMFFSGFGSSALRASLMIWCRYIPEYFGHSGDPLSRVALSFVIMTVLNPFFICSVGAQLSFLASFGVILSNEFSDLVRRTVKGKHKAIFLAVSSGIFALYFTMPAAVSVGTLSVISPFANAAAQFIYVPVIGLLFFFSAASFLPFTLPAKILAEASRAMIFVLEKVVSAFALLPGTLVYFNQTVDHCYIAASLLLLAILLYCAAFLKRRRAVLAASLFVAFSFGYTVLCAMC